MNLNKILTFHLISLQELLMGNKTQKAQLKEEIQ